MRLPDIILIFLMHLRYKAMPNAIFTDFCEGGFFTILVFLVRILAGKIQVYCVQHHKDRDAMAAVACFAPIYSAPCALRRTHHNPKEYEWRWMRCLDLKDCNCEELLLMYIIYMSMDYNAKGWHWRNPIHKRWRMGQIIKDELWVMLTAEILHHLQ